MGVKLIRIVDDVDHLSSNRRRHRDIVLDEALEDIGSFLTKNKIALASLSAGANIPLILQLKQEFVFRYGFPPFNEQGEGVGQSDKKQERGDDVTSLESDGGGEQEEEQGQESSERQDDSQNEAVAEDDDDQSSEEEDESSESGEGQEGESSEDESQSQENDGILRRGQEIGRLPSEQNASKGQGKPEFHDLQESDDKGEEGDESGQKAGNEEGDDTFETEISVEDLSNMIASEFNLPALDLKQLRTLRTKSKRKPHGWSKKGPQDQLSGMRTVIEYTKRTVNNDDPDKDDDIWVDDDLRYPYRVESDEYISSAVLFLVRDSSGSINEEKINIIRALSVHFARAVRLTHKEAVLEFITFDTVARQCSEEEFLYKKSSGGTIISTGSSEVLKMIQERYSSEEWNIFVLFFTDGENQENDMDDFQNSFATLLKLTKLFGYFEVFPSVGPAIAIEGPAGETLYYPKMPVTEEVLAELQEIFDNFVPNLILSEDDVAPAFEALVEAAEKMESRREHANR